MTEWIHKRVGIRPEDNKTWNDAVATAQRRGEVFWKILIRLLEQYVRGGEENDGKY